MIVNTRHNQKLLNGLERVAVPLNAIGIEPVLLKGAAHLVDNIYPSVGLRVVGDLDVLVTEDRVKSAADTLQKIGIT